MEIYVAILTGCAVIVLLILFGLAFRLWITFRVIEEFFISLDRESSTILQNLQESSQHLNKISYSIRQQAEKAEGQLDDTRNKLLDTIDNYIEDIDNMRQKILTIKTGASLIPSGVKLYNKFFGSQNKNSDQKEVDDNG